MKLTARLTSKFLPGVLLNNEVEITYRKDEDFIIYL